MKVLLIGANGQLGSDVVKIFSKDSFYQVTPVNFPQIDTTKIDTIESAIEQYKTEMIISTAAFHRVDECETHPEEAFGVNAFGVRNLCLVCQKRDITLVHFSTDYVFGKDAKRKTPYAESDLPGPQSVYAVSKLAGEYLMQYLLKKYFLVRTCGLYGATGPMAKSGNFVDNIVAKNGQKEVEVVSDQVLTPTSTVDLANNLKELLKTKNYGLYHITDEGSCSWFEFAQEIYRLLNSSTRLVRVTSDKFPLPAKRPNYSVLENSNLKKINLNLMRPWPEALKSYMQEKAYLK